MKKKLVIFYSLARREFKAFKLKKWLIIFIILASFNLTNSVSGQTEKNDSSSSLSKLQQFRRSYPVKFLNKTKKKIFLCVSTKKGYLIAMIPADQNFEHNLDEGEHIMGYMDIDGKSLGKAQRPGRNNILWENYSVLSIEINNQNYEISRTYNLSVLSDDDLVVSLYEDNIRCKSENVVDKDVNQFTVFGILLILVIFIILISHTLSTPSKFSNLKTANAKKNAEEKV